MYVRRGQLAGDDHTGPGDAHMGAEAVEGLLRYGIVAESRLPGEAFAALGPRKPAHGHREAVDDRDLLVVLDPFEQALPKPFFDGPEVGRLSGETHPVQPGELREERAVVGGGSR